MLGDVDEDLLPIGQFARLSRLSVKQLRHYDELGLLEPAYVDGDTGYRYYRPSQARTALSIGLLRSLDVPLPAVGEVLAGRPGALESVRDALESELARRRQALAALERVMAEGLPEPPVRVVEEPAHRAAVVREPADGPEGIGAATSAAVARLMAARHASGPSGGPGGGPGGGQVRLIGLFPADLGDVVDVAVALVLDPGDPWEEPPAGVRTEVLPGGTFAMATHVGPYGQIALTAHAVLAWCAERRLRARGPIREVYVSDPAVTPPERLVTHLMIALQEER
ncbi:MerR family transcriptional regulator [Nonomuraea sp. NPDC023979]|uniref:MerR family transcriptional regulator n=1 Tax=Nonomuraea sp. NPDC023979 TaxID=3154796 RepID=UPI0033CEC4A4